MKRFRQLRELLHAMVGLPNYERYLEHQKTHHPADAALSYEAFYKLSLQRRYDGRRAKCC